MRSFPPSVPAEWARCIARDTKLNRVVAIKMLPEAFLTDPDRVARFEREAQILAALNHPHIAAVHGLGESAGVRAHVTSRCVSRGWMAYQSQESGQNQIYVRPFPKSDNGRWQISTTGAGR